MFYFMMDFLPTLSETKPCSEEIKLKLCYQGRIDHQYFLQANNYNYLFFSRNPTPSLFSEKYYFCLKCFNDVQGDIVSLCDDPAAAPT